MTKRKLSDEKIMSIKKLRQELAQRDMFRPFEAPPAGKIPARTLAIIDRLRFLWYGNRGKRQRRVDYMALRQFTTWELSDQEILLRDAEDYIERCERKWRVTLHRFIMDPTCRDRDAWWRRRPLGD